MKLRCFSQAPTTRVIFILGRGGGQISFSMTRVPPGYL